MSQLRVEDMKLKKYEYNKEELIKAVKDSTSYSEVLRKIGIPIQGNNGSTLKRYLEKYEISTAHFTGHQRHNAIKYVPVTEYLNSDRIIASSKLLYKLYREGLKEPRCEKCGITEWNGEKLTFQLHHRDGNHNNNTLENLQVLCPNCHSQTDNYCGSASPKEKHYCKECGRELKTNCVSELCFYCASKMRRKVSRPDLETLLNDVEELGYLGTGRKYGVSDSAVRKWIKTYQEETLK
jgi:hypothetical protein